MVKYSFHALPGVVTHKKDQHKVTLSENHGEKNFPFTPGTHNRIHFKYRGIRMCLQIARKVFVGASLADTGIPFLSGHCGSCEACNGPS